MNVDKMKDLTTIKRTKALAYPMPSGLGRSTYQTMHNGEVFKRPKTVTAKPVPEEMSDPNRKACKAPAFMDQLFFNPTTAKKMIDHRIQEANSFPLQGKPTTAATIVNHFEKGNPLVKSRPHNLDVELKNRHKVRMEGYNQPMTVSSTKYMQNFVNHKVKGHVEACVPIENDYRMDRAAPPLS